MIDPREVFRTSESVLEAASIIAETEGKTAYIIKKDYGWSIVTRRHNSQKIVGHISHKMFGRGDGE